MSYWGRAVKEPRGDYLGGLGMWVKYDGENENNITTICLNYQTLNAQSGRGI